MERDIWEGGVVVVIQTVLVILKDYAEELQAGLGQQSNYGDHTSNATSGKCAPREADEEDLVSWALADIVSKTCPRPATHGPGNGATGGAYTSLVVDDLRDPIGTGGLDGPA
ncbi:MAG: hypothetical protein LQ340_001764 [Diploschistes diacapsis]|nr:MAG: hypothetical protein LQ340_001764 [Diploschistes diacapsis]